MAMEFPSRIAAAGFVQGAIGAFNANARGCVVTQTGIGNYLITLDRAMTVGWAALLVTTTADIPFAASHVTPTTFVVVSLQADFDFFFVIHAIDESQ